MGYTWQQAPQVTACFDCSLQITRVAAPAEMHTHSCTARVGLEWHSRLHAREREREREERERRERERERERENSKT